MKSTPSLDLLVQKYLCSKNYKNVTVYHSGSKYRNCIDPSWTLKSVKVPYGVTGRDFYAVKDKQMAIDADIGMRCLIICRVTYRDSPKSITTVSTVSTILKKYTPLISNRKEL